MKTAASVDAAQRAVVAFVREEACLPAFDEERWLLHDQYKRQSDDSDLDDSVVRVVATDKVFGQVLPTSHDAWLAVAPFREFPKSASSEEKIALVEKRRQFVELLARLATSGPFAWIPSTMSCGESVGTDQMENRFWIELLRELCPDAKHDGMMDMGRDLIALSRGRRPRLLICIGSEAATSGFMGLLSHFLAEKPADDALYGSAVSACGLPASTTCDLEVGISFTKGKITTTIITGLLNVLKQVDLQPPCEGVQFQLTTLRFGRECIFEATAVELLNEYPWGSSRITNLRLSGLVQKKKLRLRKCLHSLLRPTSSIRRLSDSSPSDFKAYASAVRHGGCGVRRDVCGNSLHVPDMLDPYNALAVLSDRVGNLALLHGLHQHHVKTFRPLVELVRSTATAPGHFGVVEWLAETYPISTT